MLVTFLATAAAARAQAAPIPRGPAVSAVLARVRANNAWTLAQQRSICQVAAPPFRERARAQEMRRRFTALGLRNVRIDSIGNVIGERPGARARPRIVLAAHLDTVFPEGTNVAVRGSGARMAGPGIGDDCRGLAVLLAVARALRDPSVSTEGTLVFVANVGEEGPGNLRGTRWLYEHEFPGAIDGFLTVDSPGLSMVSHAVGSHRYRVRVTGPGGHSYGAFGMPNPIHALGRAIAGIADIAVPATPKTTFNVGVIEGGTSVNSIATEAQMEVDLRSESAQELDRADAAFRRTLDAAVLAEQARWPASPVRLRLTIDTLGIRPTGAQPDDAPIVRTALAAAEALGFRPPIGAASTDANIPISLGLPGIQISGGGDGQGAHSPDETYDDGPRGWLGPQWAALLALALAGVR